MADRGTVFLDRDGVINAKPPEGNYVTRPEQLALLPGAGEALTHLGAAGLRLLVVTNQRGVALGRMSAADLDLVHERLRALLAAHGATLDGIYACPHEHGSCDCRKPATGLFEQARRDHPGIDLRRSAMVGDAEVDMEAARRLGIAGVLVGSRDPGPGVAHAATSLAAAVPWLLERLAVPGAA